MRKPKTEGPTIEQMAEAMLNRNALGLRLLVQAWLRMKPRFARVPRPTTKDPRVLTAAAALVELLAERANQSAPPWSAGVGGLPEPFFVVSYADQPGFTRDLCLREAPAPFARRNIFSPPNFLHMV